LVNEQADVYSLATIAYYLLTGALPYTGRSPRELFQQLLTQPPIRLNQAVKGLRFPDAVEEAIMAGLERDLTRRTRTMEEFTVKLCAVLRAGGGGERKSFLKSLFGK
jgi:serine/threonine-protein kinase